MDGAWRSAVTASAGPGLGYVYRMGSSAKAARYAPARGMFTVWAMFFPVLLAPTSQRPERVKKCVRVTQSQFGLDSSCCERSEITRDEGLGSSWGRVMADGRYERVDGSRDEIPGWEKG